jgi:hypothetical protein
MMSRVIGLLILMLLGLLVGLVLGLLTSGCAIVVPILEAPPLICDSMQHREHLPDERTPR